MPTQRNCQNCGEKVYNFDAHKDPNTNLWNCLPVGIPVTATEAQKFFNKSLDCPIDGRRTLWPAAQGIVLPPQEGRKYDEGKLDYSLLPLSMIVPVIQVLMYGAKKYSPNNWKLVPSPRERYTNALLRHIQARQDGEILDPETKLPHWAHAACCVLFLLWFDTQKGGADDS